MEEKDQLSNLPISMVHEILSRLPEEDVARTSVLSKDCAKALSTFPYLSFCDTKIQSSLMGIYLRKRNNFVDNVRRTLQRFCINGLFIKQFKLTLNFYDLYYLSNNIDLWLKLATKNGVEMLEVFQADHTGEEEFPNYECYILPIEVLEAKSLTKLVLTNKIGVDLTSINRSINFFSLKTLSLVGVLLGDEDAFKLLISRCSLLEYITLKQCYSYPGGQGSLHHVTNSRIKSLSLRGLTRLREVNVEGIQEVYVDSTCLENLHYYPSTLEEDYDLHFNDCVNLRKLTLPSLRYDFISDIWLSTLLSRYSFLERLKLDYRSISDGINVSSVRLKVFELANYSTLKTVTIDAPNLLSCVYMGYPTTKRMSFLRSSSQLEVKVSTIICHLDFSNISEFIQNFKPKSVLASTSISLHIDYPMVVEPIFWQVSSVPPSIKHLEICYVSAATERFDFTIVNRLLSICCPTTISIHGCTSFIENLYKTLVNKNKEEYHCCSGKSECWWHGLKGVKVTSSKTMVDSMELSSSQQNVSFTLEF